MNILIFGSENETDEVIDLIEANDQFLFRKKNYVKATDYDDFLEKLNADKDVIFVLENGAKGMESAIAAKSLYPKTPVIWFSEDKDFGVQAYRVGAEFFGIKPVTNEHLSLVAKKLMLR